MCVLVYVCVTVLVGLYAWSAHYTYHRSRSYFWQALEESVIKCHVTQVEWFQFGHGGDGLSTQPGCLRVESQPIQCEFHDLWKNDILSNIFKRRVSSVKQYKANYHVSIILWGWYFYYDPEEANDCIFSMNKYICRRPDRSVHYFQSQ